jgi:uncharacterized repeat protein (TIGR01451 family)
VNPSSRATTTGRGVRSVTRRSLWVLVLASLIALAGATSAGAAGPIWRISSLANTTAKPGATITYHLQVQNVGTADTDGSLTTTTITLPPGLTGVSATGIQAGVPLACAIETGAIQCPTNNPVPIATENAGGFLQYTLVVAVDPGVGTPTTLTPTMTVSGGGAADASTADPTRIVDGPPAFGLDAFDAQIAAGAAGGTLTQAGGHPYSISTSIDFNTTTNPLTIIGDLWPVEPTKDTVVDLPPGFVGSPADVDQCTSAQLANGSSTSGLPLCPATSQVGTVLIHIKSLSGFLFVVGPYPVYNMVPPPGTPARFGFNVVGVLVTLNARLRSSGDYGLSIDADDVSEGLAIAGTTVTFWGVPSDPSHDPERSCPGHSEPAGGGPSCPSGAPPHAFLRNPTSCRAEAGSPVQDGLVTKIAIDSWDDPGGRDSEGEPVAGDSRWVTGSYVWHQPPGYPNPPEVWGPNYLPSGCDKVPFTPSLAVTPSTPARAGAPSGMTFEAKLPQSDDPSTIAEGDVQKTVVTLPRGLTVNPSAASGLAACSEAQIGYLGTGVDEPNPVHFNNRDPECPESSKIATAELETPLLAKPLKGEVYLAAQDENPFHSLLASYLVVQGQGITIKLAGQVQLDPATGQITATFDHTPQAPFSTLKLTFKEGPRALFILPPDCGTYTMAAQMDSWSGASVLAPSSFTLSEGEGGCAGHGFSPSFSSGTQSNEAGAYSPLSISFSRADGDQQFSGLTETLAPGLSAKLAGVPLCSDQDASAGTCPAASQIGTVLAGSGAGPSPFFLKGQVYLTGSYNGGPFGEVVVVPVVAGPFNLGNVIVRGSIRIDPRTAQATVASDPFPRFVGNTGIPTDVRRVDVTLDRPGFSFNPTSCEAESITGALSSVRGVSVPVSSHFQAANCANLLFHPVFSASTQASTSKAKGASLTVKVTSGQGQANIGRVDVQLPKQLPARLTTLQKACTEAQFDTNPAGCPVASVIGTAKAITPLLGSPLTGPVYLVSHGGVAFPDVEFLLQGEGVRIELDGKTQIKHGITSNHFETVPDAPITSFETTLPEGPYSVLSTNIPPGAHNSLCGLALSMPTTLTGHNGAVIHQNTRLGVTGCAKKKTLTRAQRLAAALKICRHKAKSRRTACERAARKRYASVRRRGKR